MKTIRFAIVGAALALSATAAVAQTCKPAHDVTTVRKGTLTVQIVPSLPYIDYKDGKLTGIDGDVVTKIAERECLKLQVNIVGAAVAISSIQSGLADMAAGGWYNTPERGQVVGQTDTVYYDFIGMVSRGGKLSSVDDMMNKTVGVISGSLFVGELQKLIGAGNVRQYQSTDATFGDLRNGRIDLALTGSGEAGYLLSQPVNSGLGIQAMKPDQRFSPSLSAGKVNFPHTKSNATLTKALNDDIKVLRDDGTVKSILVKWGLTSPANFEQ